MCVRGAGRAPTPGSAGVDTFIRLSRRRLGSALGLGPGHSARAQFADGSSLVALESIWLFLNERGIQENKATRGWHTGQNVAYYQASIKLFGANRTVDR